MRLGSASTARCLLVVAALCGWGQSANATPAFYADTVVQVCLPNGATCQYTNVASGNGSATGSKTYSPFGNYISGETAPQAFVSGSATVSPNGLLGAILSIDVYVPMDPSGAGASLYGFSQAISTDYLTITASGRTGSGVAKITASFHGGVYYQPSGSPGPCFALTSASGTPEGSPPGGPNCQSVTGYSGGAADAYYDVISAGALFSNFSPAKYSVLGNPTVTYLVPFTFGTQFALTQDLAAYVDVYAGTYSAPFDGPASANATSDFADTAEISHIQIYDSNGDPIPDFSISAVSGLNYTADGLLGATPVPEPCSFAIFLAGLGAIAAALRGSSVRNRLLIRSSS